jgi:hypothetical protein
MLRTKLDCPINKTTGEKMHDIRCQRDVYGHIWRSCVNCGSYSVKVTRQNELQAV